jgi:hypothetical protein
MINEIRNMVISSRLELEEMVSLRSMLKNIAANFEDLKLDIPSWISTKLQDVEVVIKDKVRAERSAALTKLRARRDALMTADEKRKKLDEDIASLEEVMK